VFIFIFLLLLVINFPSRMNAARADNLWLNSTHLVQKLMIFFQFFRPYLLTRCWKENSLKKNRREFTANKIVDSPLYGVIMFDE